MNVGAYKHEVTTINISLLGENVKSVLDAALSDLSVRQSEHTKGLK